jgi:hypothetical protein
LLLTGCATQRPKPSPPPPPTGDASWRIKEPPEGTKRYQLAMGSVATGSAPVVRVTPVYPPGELSICPAPLELEALLIVDANGEVRDVRVANEAQADMHRRQFIDAVRAAASQWNFMPLHVNHWASDADGNSHVVDSETLPFSQAYEFRFECHAGKAQVSGGTAITSRP